MKDRALKTSQSRALAKRSTKGELTFFGRCELTPTGAKFPADMTLNEMVGGVEILLLMGKNQLRLLNIG